MSPVQSITALQVTNQCVVVCDLERWTGPDSAAWEAIAGSQDDIGRRLAAILDSRDVRRIDDFGGVCETFLCAEEEYVENPLRRRAARRSSPSLRRTDSRPKAVRWPG
jgi:hypothetical protein